MRSFLSCLACIFSLACFAQNRADTVRLFYAIGSTQPERGLQALDSLVQAHPHDSITFSVCGYADFLGNAAANQRLSESRAARAQQLILDKKYPYARMSSKPEGRGDKASRPNGSSSGEPYARRVEVVLLYAPLRKRVEVLSNAPVKQEEEKTDAPKPEEPKTVAKKDITDLNVGEAMTISGLNFYGGRHYLLPESKKPLLNLLQALKDHPTMQVEIQGHVCCTAGKDDGLDLDTGRPKLSENRARVVYNYLVDNGIDASRLRYRGFGHARPLVWPELSEDDMQANRRVEIMIIHK